MTVKMWRTDLLDGLVTHEELRDGSEYMDTVVDGILRGLPPGLRTAPDLYVGLKYLEGA